MSFAAISWLVHSHMAAGLAGMLAGVACVHLRERLAAKRRARDEGWPRYYVPGKMPQPSPRRKEGR